MFLQAFGGGGTSNGHRDGGRVTTHENTAMEGCSVPWGSWRWSFLCPCLAASGTFPTEERYFLEELIRKCLSLSVVLQPEEVKLGDGRFFLRCSYLAQTDGLKSDLAKTARYDISPESSNLKQDGVAYFTAQMNAVSNSAFISHLPI